MDPIDMVKAIVQVTSDVYAVFFTDGSKRIVGYKEAFALEKTLKNAGGHIPLEYR